MFKVDVIKSAEDIEKIKAALLKGDYKNYLMFMIGLCTGMPITQILLLKVKDIIAEDGQVKASIERNDFTYVLDDDIRSCLLHYIRVNYDVIKNKDYIFKGHRGNTPIHVSEACRILNVVGNKIGLKVRFGTHTLSKTYGYHFYMNNHDIKHLCKLYRHAAYYITEEYIGLK